MAAAAADSDGAVVRKVDDVTLTWDLEQGALTFFGFPSVLFWLSPSLANVLSPLAAEIGVERFRLLVAEHARLGTDEDYHAMVTVLADSFQDGFLAWGRGVGVAGWGAFSIEAFDEEAGTARVIVRNPWELRLHADPALGWGCPFLMGKMIGIFGQALGGPCAATEVALGGDPPAVAFDIRRVPDELAESSGDFKAADLSETPVAPGPPSMAALEAIGALAGGMAHNFNNRLLSVLGCISMAQSRADQPKEAARLLNQAVQHIHNARRLSQQLLTFSRGGEPVRRSVDLEALLREVAAQHCEGRTCELRIHEGVGAILGDCGQLRVAIGELLRNAVQASPEDRPIQIDVGPHPLDGGQEAGVRVSVRDHGPGLSEAARRRAFELFFTTRPGCHGLGLSVAYSVAHRHGGTLHFESQEGRGAVFHLTLPLAPIVEPESGEALEVPAGLRVLLVDDDPDVLQVERDMLAHCGCEPTCAETGRDAVELLRARCGGAGAPFDLVLLDLMLPGELSGIGAFEEMRVLAPDLPVIVCSGYHDDPVMSDYRRHGLRAALPKPFSLAELEQALQQALR